MRFRSVSIALAPAAAFTFAAGAGAALAKKKKRKAGAAGPKCSVTYLQLAEGNSWEFELVNPLPKGPPPAKIELKVAAVAVGDDGNTVITLQENFRGRSHQSQLTCKPEGLVVPPTSFLFAGEPGGSPQIGLDNEVHTGVTYPADKAFRQAAATWEETYKADVTRQVSDGSAAKIEPARVEVERDYAIGATNESVETTAGAFNRVTRLDFQMSGRAFVGEKDREVPVQNNGAIWIDRKLGVVRLKDSIGLEWALTTSSLLAAE